MTQQSNSDNSFPVAPALVFFGGLALILAALFAASPGIVNPKVTTTPVAITVATAAPQEVAAVGLDPVKVKAGEQIFQSVCFACHGFNAKGIPGLGKTLIGSQFFDSHTDSELVTFLQNGRPVTDPLNTTGVAMPARGGNPSLTDDNLLEVIAYIHSLNGVEVAAVQQTNITPTATLPPAEFNAGAISSLLGTGDTGAATATTAPVSPAANATAAPGVAATTVAVIPTTALGSNTFASPGAADYVRACAGCHGIDGKGQPMLTKPLSDSDMLKSMNTFGIINLFTTAHPPTIEFQHPYRGGYPELSDNQLLGIVTYLITLPR